MSGEESVVLDGAGLHAPARARSWISARTLNYASETVQDALLIASELVTNAVRHGAPEIVLGLRQEAGRIVIFVSDGGDGMPILPTWRPPAERTNGRGLLIVAATALEWGVSRRPGQRGKTVWAALSRRDRRHSQSG
jgi:two-component sensor histidine kinase